MPAPPFLVKISAALCLRFIYLTVDLIGGKPVLRVCQTVDLALFHYDDAIRILHAGDTLGDDQLRRIRDLLPKCPSDLASVAVSTALYCRQ